MIGRLFTTLTYVIRRPLVSRCAVILSKSCQEGYERSSVAVGSISLDTTVGLGIRRGVGAVLAQTCKPLPRSVVCDGAGLRGRT